MSTTTPKRGNGITSRLAVLEHAVASLVAEQNEMREKLGSLYGYVFGDANTSEPLKSQVTRIAADVKKLTGYLNVVHDLQAWKQTMEKKQEGLTKDRREYKFILVGAVISSSVSIVIGWLLGRFIG